LLTKSVFDSTGSSSL